MATFGSVVFRNLNGISVDVTLEAPISGTLIGPEPVAPNATLVIPVGLPQCSSVLVSVSDSAHVTYSQSFATAPAKQGRASYLTDLMVAYSVGNFVGKFTAETDAFEWT